ncbi:MAG: hypothetical protein MUF25_17560, partial [Pirellulaceae bacterium]|nr:hypothetical protein [Pirellulaceae bacterium]
SSAPLDGKAANVRPVATWAEDGSMAVVEAKLGRGKIILLGSIFFTRMRDEKGSWVSDADRGKLLDEFLTHVGVERDSWADGVWAEIWRSKNGVYDLYPVARMARGDKAPATVSAQVSLRRAAPVSDMVEVSALGHPKVKVESKDGRITLPAADYGQMQSRVYIAPRAEIVRAAFDWFQAQAKIWRELPPLPPLAKPAPIPVPDDRTPPGQPRTSPTPAGSLSSWARSPRWACPRSRRTASGRPLRFPPLGKAGRSICTSAPTAGSGASAPKGVCGSTGSPPP